VHQEKSNNAVLILLPFLLFKMDKVELRVMLFKIIAS
ncbi:hypothetical protein AVDCRST_MAG81-4634, partial [uncultured Synechococcales cyanobacterium]